MPPPAPLDSGLHRNDGFSLPPPKPRRCDVGTDRDNDAGDCGGDEGGFVGGEVGDGAADGPTNGDQSHDDGVEVHDVGMGPCDVVGSDCVMYGVAPDDAGEAHDEEDEKRCCEIG